MKVQNFLEYLYDPYIGTLLIIKSLIYLSYYLLTNEKCDQTFYNDSANSTNEYKIKKEKRYILENFTCIIKLSYLCFIFWFVYIMVINLSIIDTIKLFII